MVERVRRKIVTDRAALTIEIDGVTLDAKRLDDGKKADFLLAGISHRATGVADLAEWFEETVTGLNAVEREKVAEAGAWREAGAIVLAVHASSLGKRPHVAQRGAEHFTAALETARATVAAWGGQQFEAARRNPLVQAEYNALRGISCSLDDLVPPAVEEATPAETSGEPPVSAENTNLAEAAD